MLAFWKTPESKQRSACHRSPHAIIGMDGSNRLTWCEETSQPACATDFQAPCVDRWMNDTGRRKGERRGGERGGGDRLRALREASGWA
jgi:hypothetical protein